MRGCAYCIFEGEPEFSQLGFHFVYLAPGEPMSMDRWEADQEDFLSLDGEAPDARFPQREPSWYREGWLLD